MLQFHAWNPDNIKKSQNFQVLEYVQGALRKVYEGLMKPSNLHSEPIVSRSILKVQGLM